MADLQLHLDPRTINCRKVLAGLDMMEVPYKVNTVDFFKGEQKSPEYLKINPCATVPAATTGDLIVTESNAILMYGADIAGAKGEAAYPKDPAKRALVNRWLLWESCAWFPSSYAILCENVIAEKPDQKVLDTELEKWNKQATILNDQLSKTKFLAGETVTIADIAVMSPIHVHSIMKLPLDKYPNLQRWISDVEALPAWQQTRAPVAEAFGLDKKYVRSTLNYTKDKGDQLTEVYFYEDERAAHVNYPGDDAQVVQIHNGWEQKDSFSADKNGFSFHQFESAYPVDGWQDDDRVKNEFYPEVVEFLKKTVGAKRVLVFDHTIRSAKNDPTITQESNTSQRTPVKIVHCDYTAESGPIRVQQLLGDEAEDLLSRRVAFFNVWKPLAKVEEMPLTMCDVTSAPMDDFFKLFLRYRDRTGENYVMRHSPDHRWYYFPDMDEHQCILLKTYESDEKKARFVGHTAFEDPTSKRDAPLRESVEIRTIAFF